MPKTSNKTQPQKPVSGKIFLDKYKLHKQDTGSVQVQIALLSDRINDLAGHLKQHKKDNDSRRGLLILVGKRRRLLNYLRKNELATYEKLVKDLGLRK